MSHQKILSPVLFMFLITTVGCASSGASISQFSAADFSGESIDSVAVFPIRNASAAPAEAQQMNRRISQEVSRKSASVAIVGPAEAIKRLNDNNLADDWGDFYEDYSQTGVPNSRILQKVGKALGVDVILQGALVRVVQQDGEFGGNKGTTRVTVRFSLLGTAEGSRLWEASAEGHKTTATTLDSAPPTMEAIRLAVDKLVSNMPRMGDR